MSLKSLIRKGRRQTPPRLMVYGTEKIGKSTFAACAPSPIFVPTEDGTDQLDTNSYPMAQTYGEFISYLDDLIGDPEDYATVVIDSADWLERLIWDEVCRVHNEPGIETVLGGYSKGYIEALKPWREVLRKLEALRDRHSMAVIMICHAKVEKFQDPESNAYDRYTPKLNKHAQGLIDEWADAILFATRKIRTTSEDAGFNKKRTIAKGQGSIGGERILRAVGSPFCVAGNRYGLEEELPLEWDAVAEGIAAHYADQELPVA